uniref:Obscurin-like protein 1 n=1 Tax=Noccaea caerulescens TaxID=107243 RepID=A0A1J3JRS1_NOCCA
MARKANSSLLFLEEWLKGVSGINVSGGLVKQNSAPSARSIIQAWSEIRESLQTQKFDTRYLQALRALVSSESTIHVADPQAKLLTSILALREVSLPSESYTLVLRLLYVWIRKSFRPSQALVGSAVQAIRGGFDDRRNLQREPALVAQSVLVSGAFACVPSLSGEMKLLSLELLCRLLEEEECSLVGSQEELVPVVLAGIGYALSSSLDAHYLKLLDFLFGIWLKDEGPRGSITHGLMILHLIEWVMSGYMRSNNVDKMSLFANEVLETSKAKYAVFAVFMAAAGVLRASAAGVSNGAQNFEIVSKLRSVAEKRMESEAQLLVSSGNVTLASMQREVPLLKCFAIALARCGSVSPSAPLLLCLASALLTQVFPLGQIYESFCKASGNGFIGPELIWVREHLSDVIFKESGAITGAFCNQYASASQENKYIVENMIWDFCQNLYLQHRQIALLLRGIEETLLDDIEKIAESSFLMVVVFALAVTKQWLKPIVSEERKMETSVKILVSFSCVEYFRHIRLPEYMETIREVISRVQENDATCVSFVESIPAYDSLTSPKDLFMQRIEYEWSRDDVQTSRILFYLRVIPTCIGRLSASAFRRVVASTMFLYIGHPNRKVARASHTLLVAFLSSAKESEDDERNQLKEQLVFYYMQRSLELYPEITPFEGLASGVAALTRHLPAGSPAIFYTVHSLVEKASTFNTDALQGKGSDPGNQILELLLRLVSLVDIQVLPYLMKSLAQLVIKLPKERQNMVLGELYGQVAESDDVIRKPSLVSWLQSLNYLCSNNRTNGSASGPVIDTSNQLAARL